MLLQMGVHISAFVYLTYIRRNNAVIVTLSVSYLYKHIAI